MTISSFPTGHPAFPPGAVAPPDDSGSEDDEVFRFCERNMNPQAWRPTIPAIVLVLTERKPALRSVWITISWLIALYAGEGKSSFGLRQIADETGVGRNQVAHCIRQLADLKLLHIVGHEPVSGNNPKGLAPRPIYRIDLHDLEARSGAAMLDKIRRLGIQRPPASPPPPGQLPLPFGDASPGTDQRQTPGLDFTSASPGTDQHQTPAPAKRLETSSASVPDAPFLAAEWEITGDTPAPRLPAVPAGEPPDPGTGTGEVQPWHCEVTLEEREKERKRRERERARPQVAFAAPEPDQPERDHAPAPQRSTDAAPTERVPDIQTASAAPRTDVLEARIAQIEQQQQADRAALAQQQQDHQAALDGIRSLLEQIAPALVSRRDLHAPAQHAPPASPPGQGVVPAHPIDLWHTLYERPRAVDIQQLEVLIGEHDVSTDGYGAYWVGRALYAANLSDDQPRIAFVKFILDRWREGANYGSETKEYTARVHADVHGNGHTTGKHAADLPPEPAPPDPAPDDTASHPAVQLYRETTGAQISAAQARAIAGTVANLDIWQQTLEHWTLNGWRTANVGNLLDAYRKRASDQPQADAPTGERVGSLEISLAAIHPTDRGTWMYRFDHARTNAEKRQVLERFRAWLDDHGEPHGATNGTNGTNGTGQS